MNTENKKFKIKIYYNSGENNFSYFIIDGQRYKHETEHFSLNDYQEYINEFKDEIKVKEIKSEKDAIQASQEAYNSKFSNPIKGYVGYKVLYDTKNDCWMVKYVSSFEPITLGKECLIIIKSTGEVLLIQLGK